MFKERLGIAAIGVKPNAGEKIEKAEDTFGFLFFPVCPGDGQHRPLKPVS